ncbi:MAG: phosphatase [Ignavibacteriales bacterium]
MTPVADLHTHTIASGHAYSTMQENARAAREKGLLAVAITDHGPAMPYGPEPFYFGNMYTLPPVIEGVRVIKGVEANIVDYDGSLDLPERYLKRMELVLAGLHSECLEPSSVEKNTAAVLGVLRNPWVHVLVHPGNPQFPVDYEKIVTAAADSGKIIEINNASFCRARAGSKENCAVIARLCSMHRVKVVLDSDAHFSAHVGDLGEAVRVAGEAGIAPEHVLNCSLDAILAVLRHYGSPL